MIGMVWWPQTNNQNRPNQPQNNQPTHTKHSKIWPFDYLWLSPPWTWPNLAVPYPSKKWWMHPQKDLKGRINELPKESTPKLTQQNQAQNKPNKNKPEGSRRVPWYLLRSGLAPPKSLQFTPSKEVLGPLKEVTQSKLVYQVTHLM